VNDRVTGARRALRRWFAGGDDSVDVAAPHGWFVLRCGRDAPSVSTVSPKASDKPPRTLVDPTFAANERGKRFTMRFVFGTVTEHARPFGSRSLAHDREQTRKRGGCCQNSGTRNRGQLLS